MVYIEIFVILIVLAYGWAGYRRGFLVQLFDLAGIVAAFILALRYFDFFASIFSRWGLNQDLTKPFGFFTLWTLLQIIFYLINLLIFHFVPKEIDDNRINRYIGIIPGLTKGVVVVAIVLMIFFILPISPQFKDNLIKYPISGFLIRSGAQAETQMEKILGDLNSLNFFGQVDKNDEEMTKLNFKAQNISVDENSENIMVNSVNETRTKAGLRELKIDYTIRTVARNHSIDMAKNSYFSHIGLDSKTPADRMKDGGVTYWLAGENIALAPNGAVAEIGFMNSPKHRDNILDPKFGRIGIGIIDLGVYGKMVTQNFAD